MTIIDARLPRLARLLPEVQRLLVVPVAAGLALGVGDLLVMTHVAYPWANLANSSAVWAAGAFALGALLRTDPPRAAIAGVVMMMVAVEGYYAWAALTGLAGTDALGSATTRMWLVFGVIAGTVFAVAGAWTSGPVWWQRVLGSAVGGGVLVGEAVHTWTHLDGATGGYRADLLHTAVAMAALGGLTVLASARTPRVLVPAALLTVPVALFTAAAFTAVGIAY